MAEDGGIVYALPVDAEAAMLEYLEMFYGIKRGGYALRRLGAIDFATTIAPGLRDVLLTGKASSGQAREKVGRPAYDAVVLDAPPTGRITRFLNVNTEIAGLAKVGPIRTQADSVMGVIRSARTAVHLVTLLEEMPVQETLDGLAELRAAGLPLGAVVINQVRGSQLDDEQLRLAAERALPESVLKKGCVLQPSIPLLPRCARWPTRRLTTRREQLCRTASVAAWPRPTSPSWNCPCCPAVSISPRCTGCPRR